VGEQARNRNQQQHRKFLDSYEGTQGVLYNDSHLIYVRLRESMGLFLANWQPTNRFLNYFMYKNKKRKLATKSQDYY
jgi:hypothetical protein